MSKTFQEFPRLLATLHINTATEQASSRHSENPQHCPRCPQPRHRFANPELHASKGRCPRPPSRLIGAGIRSVLFGIIAGIQGPRPAICLATGQYPEKRLAKFCCVDHGTKRLGDLCVDRLMIAMISTNDHHDLPPSKWPFLIRASLAGCVNACEETHGHVDIVNHIWHPSSRTTQQKCLSLSAVLCRRLCGRALTILTVLSLSDGSHLRSNARFASPPNYHLSVKNTPLRTKSKYFRKAPAPHEICTKIRSEDVQMASARTT